MKTSETPNPSFNRAPHREASTPTADAPRKEAFCLFQCGTTALAVRLDSVAELLEVERLVRLPLGSPEILGVCTLRREVIPVVALQQPARDSNGRSPVVPILALILQSERGPWALSVDPTGTSVIEDVVQTHPPETVGGSSLVLKGSLRREGIQYGVLDTESTWRKIRERIENGYAMGRGRESLPRGEPSRLVRPLES